MPGPPHPRGSLHGYADGSLPRWRRRLLDRHLRRCTRCSLEVARTRALSAWLARSEAPPPGDDLLRRLRRIGGEPEPTPPVETAVPPGHGSAVPEAVAPSPARPEAARLPVAPRSGRATVGVAGVLVAGAVLVGSAGVGAVVTGANVPWPGASAARAQLSTVLPALWSSDDRSGTADPPGGADPAPAADNGRRP